MTPAPIFDRSRIMAHQQRRTPWPVVLLFSIALALSMRTCSHAVRAATVEVTTNEGAPHGR